MDPNQLHPETLQTNVQPEALPSNEPPNEIEQTKKLSKKVLVAIFLILLILVPTSMFLYSKYNASTYKSVPATELQAPVSTPDLYTEGSRSATAGWKTYSNSEYGISFKYPADWLVKGKNSGQEAVTLQSGIGLIPGGKNQGSASTPLYIDRFDNLKKLELKAWIDDYNANSPLSRTFYSGGLQETTVGGYKAFKVDKGDCEPFYCYTAIIMANDKIFMFHDIDFGEGFGYSNQELINYRVVFDQILSTFKFLDQTSPLPSATPSGEQTACTQEAKLCPNGSYVSREGPNCEFAECP